VYFDIIGEIEGIETIAAGGRIKDIIRIRTQNNMDLADGANSKAWQLFGL